jgi:SET domain-containing protein
MNFDWEFDDLLVLDTLREGNVSRFFNHSCDPNAFPQLVMVNTHDTRHPTIAIYALKNIQAGEEITIDYNYNILNNKMKIFCLCGAKECRKVLK